ncbi:MAG: IS1380 family transposase [Acidimicrobiaceae bacterium]|nr:IS1380 family transposase [Acidimicrobiaceae bacterium]
MSVDPWPAVRVESTARALTAYGGAVLLRDVMRVLRIVEEVDACVGLKRRARGLSEGQFVSAIAESIALGATCLDDFAVNRADVAQEQLRGFPVPAPQTAGSFLRRFSLGHIHQLNKALVAIQRRAYVAAGAREVTLDFDSTYVFSRSNRRQGVDRTYKKGYALHPLLCFDAVSGAAVHARLRRGRSGPSTGIGTFVTEALRRVPDGVAVRARFDSGFYSASLFDQLDAAGATYLCGVPLVPRVLEAVRAVSDTCFAACLDKDEGEVAEFGYRLAGGGPFRRYVVKRIEIEPGEQASLETGGYRYWVFVTNDHHRSPAELESEHRHKADVEAGMRELKSNFGLGTIRKHGFMANWVWLLLVCLGHNLCRWVQQLGRLAPGRDGTEHRAKRLRYRFLVVPALVVRSGRRLSIKLPATYPNTTAFLRARHTILRHHPT